MAVLLVRSWILKNRKRKEFSQTVRDHKPEILKILAETVENGNGMIVILWRDWITIRATQWSWLVVLLMSVQIIHSLKRNLLFSYQPQRWKRCLRYLERVNMILNLSRCNQLPSKTTFVCLSIVLKCRNGCRTLEKLQILAREGLIDNRPVP